MPRNLLYIKHTDNDWCFSNVPNAKCTNLLADIHILHHQSSLNNVPCLIMYYMKSHIDRIEIFSNTQCLLQRNVKTMFHFWAMI